MKKKYIHKLLTSFFLVVSSLCYSTTYYSIANTNWTTPSTWSTIGCGGAVSLTAPGVGDDVIICSGTSVIMNGNTGNCNSLTINGTANWTSAFTTNVGTGGITINSGGDITGAVAGILTTSGGLVIAGSLTSTTVTIKTQITAGQIISGTGTLANLDISANTTNNGNLTVRTALRSTTASTLTQGSTATLTYNGSTAIVPNLDASASGNNVIYGGAAQTVSAATYHHLTISGSGTKTMAGAITVNGNLLVNAGMLFTSFYQVIGNATGTLTLASGAILNLGNGVSATNVLFPTNFIAANISLASTSTVYYNGNNAQTVSSVPSYGVLYLLNYSGSKAADGNITATTLTVTSPTTLNMSSYTLTVTGNYTSTGGLSFTSGTFNMAGNYSNTGTFTCGTGTVNFNGAAQNIKTTTYYNLTISGSNTKILTAAITVNHDLNISSGTLNSSIYQITGNATGTFTMASSTILYLGSSASAVNVLFPTNYVNSNISLSSTSNVYYFGNSAQTISSSAAYGNLYLQTYSGSKSADGNITVNGTLSITSATTLSMTTYTLNLLGDYISTGGLSFTSGTFNIAGNYTNNGAFTCGTSTVNYNGSATQTIRAVNYYHLIFSGAGSKTLAASGTIGIAGDFTRGTMIVTAGAGNTVAFNGTTQNMTGNATAFNNVTINNLSLTIASSITVNATLTLTTGVIATASNTVIIGASGTVARTSGYVNGNLSKPVITGSNITRVFEVGSSGYAPLSITFASVSTGGALTVSTSASDHPALGTSSFNPLLTVNRYWSITNTGVVYTNYSTTLTFLDADKDAGLTLSNCLIRTYDGSLWATPATGTQTSNTLQALTVTIPTSSNSIALQIGEMIPSNGRLYSIASSGWATNGTWSYTSGGASCSCIPTITDTVYIENNYTVTMNATPGNARALIIQTGGIANWASTTTTDIGSGGINITSTGNITGSVVGTLTTTGGLILNKALSTTGVIIKTQTTAGQTISGAGSLPKLDISANTTNNGNLTVTGFLLSTTASTLTQGSTATLTYNGSTAIVPNLDASASGNNVIYGGAAQTVSAATYHHLTISSSGTKTMAGAITVNGNLLVNAGMLFTSFYQITGNVTGTLTVSAGASLNLGHGTNPTNISFPTNFTTAHISLASTSTVYYNGNSVQTVSSVPASYGILNLLNYSGSKAADGNITATTLTVNSPTTLNMSSYTLTITGNYTSTGGLSFTSGIFNIAGNWINNGTFTCGIGTVNYNGTTTISGASTNSFNNVTLSGTLTGPLSGNINIAGNWVNNGIFNSNNGTVTFNGTTVVSGASTNNLNNILISGALTAPSANMNVAGNWVNNGTYTHNTGTTTFNGITIISGSSTTGFNNVTISGTLTGHSTNMNIGGNWINNGTYIHNSGTVTFNGTSSITGSATTDFNNVTISGTLTSHPVTVDIAGNWVDNGVSLHNSGTVNFNGTTTISGSSLHSFNNIAISGTLTGPSDMNVSGNWSNDGTYNSNSGTIVFNGTTTVSGSSTTSFNNITISSTLIGHNNAMEVTGDMVTNGSYTSNNGLITFNGPSLQSLSGSGIADFELMTLNNANGMNINSGNYYLHDVITLTAGTISNIGGAFTLVADATRYSRIAPIDALCATCGFSGNFDVQRYIPSRTIGTWADLSSPVSNATMADWDYSLFLVYPFLGFDEISNRPTGSNVMAYDEPLAAYYELNSSTPLNAGMGFEIGLTDDATGASFSSTTLNTIGTPNFGTYDIPLSYTAANGAPYPVGYSGENLVGNPYASAIDLSALVITNALTTVDVYDYNIDNYLTLSGSDVIGPHQGFWAYAQSIGASILIPETAKTTNSSTDLHRSITQNTHPYLNLTLSSADGSNTMAHTLSVACNENASDGWDNSDHPFRKSLNPKAPSITANAGEAVVSINTFNNNHETYVMPLNLKIGIDGKYQLVTSGIEHVRDYTVVLLEDKLTHTFINLNNSNDYTFTARSTDPKQRFALHFSKSADYNPSSTAIVNNLANEVQILPNSTGNIINFNLSKTENIVISVMDVLGKNIIGNMNVEANNQSVNITLPESFHGLYFITVQSESEKTVKKFVAEK